MRCGHGRVVETVCGLATVARASNSNAALGTGLRRYDGLDGWCAFSASVPATGWKVGAFAHLSARTNAAGPKPATASPTHSSFRRRPESRSAPGYERTCAAGTAAWSSRLWPCHRRACIQAHAALGTGLRRYDELGHRSGQWRLMLVIPANAVPDRRPDEPMCLPSKACGRAVCGLATVKRAPNSNAALGTGLRRYDGVGAPIRPVASLIRSSFRRRPESDRRLDMNQCALRARPRGRAICGFATVERASNSNAALGTGLRRYDEMAAPIGRVAPHTLVIPANARHDGLIGAWI